MDNEEPSLKNSRTRSPAYPAIDLEEALEKAQVLWRKAGRHPVSIDLLNSYWGLDSKSSAGISAASAIKKFGILVEEGTKGNRTLRMSDLGLQLIYNPDLNSPEFGNALKTAALHPTIHRELWAKYEGNLPADDGIISRYLVVERRFNESYVSGFIQQLRRTIAFAKLSPADGLPPENSDIETAAPTESARVIVPPASIVLAPSRQTLPQPPSQQTVSPSSANLDEITLPLDTGQVVKIPIPMSEESFELLIATLNLWKRRIVGNPK